MNKPEIPADAKYDIADPDPAAMIEALRAGGYHAAYVVLGGQNWRFRDFYLNHGLDPFIPAVREIQIVALEEFIARANQGRL